MKAKTALIAALCILLLASCQNSTGDIPTADATDSIQSSEPSETASNESAAETETAQNNTELSDTADNTDNRQLTADEAKAAALEHAGVNESEVTHSETEFDHDDGISVIEVKFLTSSHEYEYEINADNGNIIKYSREVLIWQTPQEVISAEEAENIALEHAGFSRNDVTFIKTEQDIDDKRGKYEIEFIYGSKEYEYSINAGGDIIKYEIDEIND